MAKVSKKVTDELIAFADGKPWRRIPSRARRTMRRRGWARYGSPPKTVAGKAATRQVAIPGSAFVRRVAMRITHGRWIDYRFSGTGIVITEHGKRKARESR